MVQLYGREFTRKELLKAIGDIAQVGGVRLMEYTDGPEKGVRCAEIRSGSGLNFTVMLERGMDIGPAEYMGIPLAWINHVGFPHPTFFEHENLGWLRTWGGGLLTGCGLTYAGTPSVDDGEELGLHGRLSLTPARHVGAGETWDGDNCTFWLEGEMREARVFGANLRLKRRIETDLGQNIIRIHDKVENAGFSPSPLMLVYHINLGFPLLDENCRILSVPHAVEARTPEAEKGLPNWEQTQKPTTGYNEQVFYHDLPANAAGWCEVTLENPRLGMRLSIRQQKDSLPYLAEWKQMGLGHYVLGLEPCNCRLEGRVVEREHNAMPVLQPGETRDLSVEIQIDMNFRG